MDGAKITEGSRRQRYTLSEEDFEILKAGIQTLNERLAEEEAYVQGVEENENTHKKYMKYIVATVTVILCSQFFYKSYNPMYMDSKLSSLQKKPKLRETEYFTSTYDRDNNRFEAYDFYEYEAEVKTSLTSRWEEYKKMGVQYDDMEKKMERFCQKEVEDDPERFSENSGGHEEYEQYTVLTLSAGNEKDIAYLQEVVNIILQKTEQGMIDFAPNYCNSEKDIQEQIYSEWADEVRFSCNVRKSDHTRINQLLTDKSDVVRIVNLVRNPRYMILSEYIRQYYSYLQEQEYADTGSDSSDSLLHTLVEKRLQNIWYTTFEKIGPKIQHMLRVMQETVGHENVLTLDFDVDILNNHDTAITQMVSYILQNGMLAQEMCIINLKASFLKIPKWGFSSSYFPEITPQTDPKEMEAFAENAFRAFRFGNYFNSLKTRLDKWTRKYNAIASKL